MSEFIDTAEWVPVHTLPGFECAIEYHINAKGELKSTKGGKEKLLKPIKLKNGYYKYTLQQRLGQKGEKQVYVHTLVALAFLGNPPTPLGRTKGCTQVDHKDDDKSNNCIENLQYMLQRDNINKRPYKKYQKIDRTEDDELVDACRKKYFARHRMRRLRERTKSLKIKESLDEK